MEGDSIFFTSGGDKAHIKIRVMSGKGPVPGESQKGPQGLLLSGRTAQHLVGNPGQVDNLQREHAPWGSEGVEGFGNRSVFQHDRSNFNDYLMFVVQTGSLNIETDNLIFKRCVYRTVDGDPVVHIVDEIGLHPVQDLNFLG